MKITVAIDSFKGSLSTFQASAAVKSGILRVFPMAEVFCRPLADGGEGTVDAIVGAMGGEMVSVEVSGPLGDKTVAKYGVCGNTAVMEMAQASGITLISKEKLNPLKTSTFGVGEMIADGIKRGCRHFVMGIGGSATNDGGMGMLSALGVSFFDGDKNLLTPCGASLEKILYIDLSNMLPQLKQCTFNIACDVKNPLCGKDGCSNVFGPQKGLKREDISSMDRWLYQYAQTVKKTFPTADENYPGAGSAGGLGFALLAFFGANLCPGIDLIIAETQLEEYIKKSDIVITGEGKLDGQSCMGKAPVGVAKLAKKYNKPCFALAGSVAEEGKKCNENGIDAFFSILKKPCNLKDAMDIKTAESNLSDTAEQLMRTLSAALKMRKM